MQRATKAISLVLIGTATALLGYEAVAPSHQADESGADFDTYSSTTQPTGNGYYGSHYYGSRYHHYHSGFSNFFFGGNGGGYGSSSSSSYSSSRGGSSSSHSGTARGGFGASGHAAGHASGS